MFPVGPDAGYSDDTASLQAWPNDQDGINPLAESGVGDWSHVDLQGFGQNDESAWTDDIGVNASGNGLYWFWDSMWSESQL